MCKVCGEYYIGSMIWFLYDWIKEYLINDNLLVKKYFIIYYCNNSYNIEVKVIMCENDFVNLWLYEVYYIRKYKLGLNFCEECIEFNDFLF